jgi:hypothetical protein
MSGLAAGENLRAIVESLHGIADNPRARLTWTTALQQPLEHENIFAVRWRFLLREKPERQVQIVGEQLHARLIRA